MSAPPRTRIPPLDARSARAATARRRPLPADLAGLPGRAAQPPGDPVADALAPAAAPRPARTGVRLAAFAALSAFAADRYAALVLHAPAGRVTAMVAVVVAFACLLALLDARPARLHRRAAIALAVAATVATVLITMVVLGVPATLLWPGHWGTLGTRLGRGFHGLAGDLWPYRGSRTWARLAVLLGLVVTLVPAAALAFWPSDWRRGGRRTLGLAVLLGVYVTAVANQPADNWVGQGALLALLLIAWLWLPTVRGANAARASLWLAGAGAVALAVAPGLHAAQPWLNYRAWQPFGAGTPRVQFQWDSTYGPLTWSDSPAVMFDVYAQRGEFWKVTSLDRFDGIRFLRSDEPPAMPPSSQPPPNLPGAAGYESQTFNVVGLVSDLLPAAGQVVDVETLNSGVAVQAGPDGTIAEAPPGLQHGDAYTVTSYVAHPTPDQMRSAGNAYTPDYLPYTAFDLPTPSQSGTAKPDLVAAARAPTLSAQTITAPSPGVSPAADPASLARILASPYARMFRLARSVAAGRTTSYDVAAAIDAYLHRNYAYSTTPPVRRYPLEAFLFTDKVGYCQQFAGAMALLLRMDGIPARVAVGFESGEYNSDNGDFVVRARDAHAWVEVYFNTIGWVAFDPTPPTTQLVSPAKLAALSLGGAGGKAHSKAQHQLPGQASSGPLAGHRGGGMATAPALAAAGAVAVLAALILVLGSLRLARSLEGEADGAVAELRRGLVLLGYPLTSDTTLAQLQRRLELTHGPRAGAYLALLGARRFGADGAGDSGGAGAWSGAGERRALRRALTKGGGLRARVLALVAFPPAITRRHAARRHPS